MKIVYGRTVRSTYIAHITYVVVSDRDANFSSSTGDRYILPLGDVEAGVPNFGRFQLVMENQPLDPRDQGGVGEQSWVRAACERWIE